MADRPYFTYEDQINRLINERGLVIPDEELPYALSILQMENYYNVINGYKDIFLDQSSSTERFKEGTTFREVYTLYSFDRELRNIFLKSLLIVENNVKSVIAYEFSKQYTHDNYLKLENFHIETKENKQEVSNLIGDIYKSISKQMDKHSYIGHYMEHHGYVPLWVLVNILNFGTVGIFYRNMKLKDRISVSRVFKIQEFELKKYLQILSIYRNLCAHDERLYNFKSRSSIHDNHVHHAMNIARTNGRYDHGKNDLFAVYIILSRMLSSDDFQTLKNSLFNLFPKLDSIRSISPLDVHRKMGFPQNWLEL